MNKSDSPLKGGSVSWMARNPVAANLLMVMVLLAGFSSFLNMKQEIFPEFTLDVITISISYPGSGPEEVEQGALLAIEEAVRGINGIKTITSSAHEGYGSAVLELESKVDATIALSNVKNKVDAIRSFPDLAERPTVRLRQYRGRVIDLAISGSQSERTLLDYTEVMRDELLQREGITQVDIVGERPLRIGVEVPEHALRSYGLTLRQIAQTISNTALELPAGSIRAQGGEVLLRTQERRDFASEFGDIPIISNSGGGHLRLDDIAKIEETFEEIDQEAFFDGKPVLRLAVYRVGEETPISVADEVNAYLLESKNRRPAGIDVTVLSDESLEYRDRIDLLKRNATLGLILVLLLLGLFLEPRLAFWVTLGIPISIAGSFIVLSLTGASINMISLFAFIVTLGIVVDDAIVVGENIYEMRERGIPHLQAAVRGAQQISGPVVFAVLTNVAAFMPLTLVPGAEGRLFYQIPAVAISVLILSLIESLYILPAHLAKKGREGWFLKLLGAPQRHFNPALHRFIERFYTPLVRSASRHRMVTLSFGISLLIISGSIIGGGLIKFTFFPRIDQDASLAQIVMPFGSPYQRSQEIRQHLADAARRALDKLEASEAVRGVYSRIGDSFSDFPTPIGGDGPHVINAWVSLKPASQRNITASEFTQVWREEIGEIAGSETISLTSELSGFGGPDIEIDLSHPSKASLEGAANDLAKELRNFEGLGEINDGVALGKPQLSFKITPQGQSLGIDSRYLANYIRDSFFGAVALRQQRGRNEVRVLVRLPHEDRSRLQSIENMILVAPNGGEIPLIEAAEIIRDHSYTTIQRNNGRRVIRVSASIKDGSETNANDVVSILKDEIIPKLQARYPSLIVNLEGEQRKQADSLSSLARGFAITLLLIYALLAIPFKSYIQPVIIMVTIPFGIVGALAGHLLLGFDLSIISFLGIVALSGVVVNDSLVLILAANAYRNDQGMDPFEAICRAGARRFRPILLTSLTTFFGLLPMIFETSAQARFLIPMAISLGFGILFATVIVLLLAPAVYLIVEDIRKFCNLKDAN
ncbi:efflux RND transporter permease subunit [Puniceicoccaceae bacterium K14]|nr:efflux RND transporter permease subunit [Puniceicoccaceae bacterium K14]